MDHAHENIFVARQPIIDKRQRIWGYEFLFRRLGGDNCALITDPEAATCSVIADGFALGTRDLFPETKICINVSLKGVLDLIPSALPPESVILELSANVDNPLDMLEAYGLLKDKGFTIALDGYDGQPRLDPLIDLADLVKISFTDHKPEKVLALRSMIDKPGMAFVATRIENWKAFNDAKNFGFDYYQGHFFHRPQIVPGRKLSTGQSTRLRLLQALSNDNADLAEITGIITSDPALCYRLLRYINSPAFGLRTEVSSINHAVSLLGIRPIRSWAMVAVISDMDASDKGRESYYTALHRAMFLKLLSGGGFTNGVDPETMFLLGLFSNLDSLMDMTMEQALEDLPLPELLLQALQGHGPSAYWITMLKNLERGELDAVHDALCELGVPMDRAAKAYLQATDVAASSLKMSADSPS